MTITDPARDRYEADHTRLARGSTVNFAGMALSNLCQFALTLVAARLLPQRSAGVFLEGFAALKLLVVLATIGLDVTVVRYVSLYRTTHQSRQARATVRLALALGVAAGVGMGCAAFGAASPLASYLGAPGFQTVLRIMSLGLPFAVGETVLVSASRGTGSMRNFVLVDQLLDGGLRLTLVWVALLSGFGLTGAALACSLTSVVTFGSALALSRKLVFGDRAPLQDPRTMLRFAALQWGTVVAGTGILWADTLLLGIWRPPAEVAAYSVATRVVGLGLVFIQAIGFAFQPIIGRLYAVGDVRALGRLYGAATRLATLLAAPPLILVAVFASPILASLYGHGYERAAVPLAVLSVAQIVNAVTGPGGYMVTMIGRTDLTFKINVVAVTINVVLNVILIPPYGMVGAGIAWAIAIVVMNLLRMYQAWRCLAVQPWDATGFRLFGALVAYAAAVVIAADRTAGFAPVTRVTLSAATGAVVLTCATFGLGVVRPTRVRQLFGSR